MRAQKPFASVPYDTPRKVTRRETLLQEMDRAIPWTRSAGRIIPRHLRRRETRGDVEHLCGSEPIRHTVSPHQRLARNCAISRFLIQLNGVERAFDQALAFPFSCIRHATFFHETDNAPQLTVIKPDAVGHADIQ